MNAAVARLEKIDPASYPLERLRLLDELQAAKRCLLNPAAKSQYDAALAATAGRSPSRPAAGSSVQPKPVKQPATAQPVAPQPTLPLATPLPVVMPVAPPVVVEMPQIDVPVVAGCQPGAVVGLAVGRHRLEQGAAAGSARAIAGANRAGHSAGLSAGQRDSGIRRADLLDRARRARRSPGRCARRGRVGGSGASRGADSAAEQVGGRCNAGCRAKRVGSGVEPDYARGRLERGRYSRRESGRCGSTCRKQQSCAGDTATSTAQPAAAEATGEFSRAAGRVRADLVARNILAAREHLAETMLLAGSPEEHDHIRRLSVLADQQERFLAAMRRGLQKFTATDVLELGDEIVAVIETGPESMAVRSEGSRRDYTLATMPAPLALAVARAGADENAAPVKVFFGAFHALDPQGDRETARRLWREAGAAGEPVGDLLPLLDAAARDVERQAVPDAAARKAAETRVAHEFDVTIKGAKSPEQRSFLVDHLLEAAANAEESADQYALLTEACARAATAGDTRRAFQAVDELDRRFRIDALAAKSETLAKALTATRDPAAVGADRPSRAGAARRSAKAEARRAGPIAGPDGRHRGAKIARRQAAGAGDIAAAGSGAVGGGEVDGPRASAIFVQLGWQLVGRRAVFAALALVRRGTINSVLGSSHERTVGCQPGRMDWARSCQGRAVGDTRGRAGAAGFLDHVQAHGLVAASIGMAMSEGPVKRRWFQVGLRRMFAWVAIVAILAAWATWNWRLEQQRWELLRVPQAFYFDKDRTSIKWLFFGTRDVYFIHLVPGTFDDAYLVKLRELFPEAEIHISPDLD